MGGRAEILQLLAGEDIGCNKMDLGVAVLASLRGRHLDDLAGTSLDDDETTLSESRALRRGGQRGVGAGGSEVIVVLQEKKLVRNAENLVLRQCQLLMIAALKRESQSRGGVAIPRNRSR